MPSPTRQRPRSLADQLLSESGEGEITPEEQASAAEASFAPVPRALMIPIERLVPSGDNPRKNFEGIDELAESIAERGVLQPLLVRRDQERAGYYRLIAGERRLQAARRVQGFDDPAERGRVTHLPAVIRDETDRDAFADSLAENVARNDLTRAELMDALVRLHEEYGWGIRHIARRTGRSPGDISELLNLAGDERLAPLVRDERVYASVAGEIRRLPEVLQPEAIERLRNGRIKTVGDVRRLRRDHERSEAASMVAHHPPTAPPHPPTSAYTADVAREVFGSEHPDNGYSPALTPVELGDSASAFPQQVFGSEHLTADSTPADDTVRDDVTLVIQAINVLVRSKAMMPPDLLGELTSASDMLITYLARQGAR